MREDLPGWSPGRRSFHRGRISILKLGQCQTPLGSTKQNVIAREEERVKTNTGANGTVTKISNHEGSLEK